MKVSAIAIDLPDHFGAEYRQARTVRDGTLKQQRDELRAKLAHVESLLAEPWPVTATPAGPQNPVKRP